jgi:ABC-type antimicrobial peptide transport system permease subunit
VTFEAAKTTLAPETLVSAARRQVQALDSEQPIYEVRTLAEMRDGVLAGRLNLVLLALFAAVALGLAVIGLYGVLACTVMQRQREIGVRMALGTQRRDVLGLIVRHRMRLALMGVVFGLFGALSVTRLLGRLLFEVRPFDPVTLMSVPFLLAAVALLACWLPARRAAQIDPIEALRYE